MIHRARRRARLLACAALFTGGALDAAPPAGDFLYHAQPRDTLIGIGRRLLVDPRRWHEVQILNHVVEPRRIPPGSILRIPYEWLRLTAQSATVVAVAGTVEQAGRRIAVGDVLPQGAVIETGPDGSVTLDLADGSVATLQKSSILKLDEMLQVTGAAADSIRLKLDSGRIETKVKPHRDVGRFEIITPVAVSAVRGTEFRDGFTDSDLHATTETLEGTVAVGGSEDPAAVGGNADSVAVGAGFGTRVDKDRVPLKPVALLPPPDLSALPAVNATEVLHVDLAPVPGAHGYRVQLAADETFHALAADVSTSEASADIPGLADGDYWLRARSVDPLGLEGADAVRRMTQHVLPEAPHPTRPESGSKIDGAHVRLEWGGVARAGSYALQVAGNAEFVAPVVARAPLAEPAADVNDLPPGKYFWRVAAVNARGEAGSWSEARFLTLRAPSPMPDVPRLEHQQLHFSWQRLAGTAYRLQVSRNPEFSDTVLDERTSDAEWSIPKPRAGTYYARVQSIDADGAGGAFSPPRRFFVPLPLWVKIATPVVLGILVLL